VDRIKGIAAWGVVMGIFICTMVNYMDRVNISVSAPLMIKEYGWDTKSLGFVFSAFFWGYFLLQIPMGWIADKFGPRRILGISAVYWGIFTFLSAIPSNLYVLSGVRACLGAGEAANFPAQTSFIARHLPRRMISRLQAFNLSAISLGPFVATPFAAYISMHYGWRGIFYAFAIISFIVAAYWMYVTKKANMIDSHYSDSATAVDLEKKSTPAIFENPLRQIEVWGSSVAWYSNSYVFSFLVMWLPTYFVKGRGMSVQEMAVFGSIPWAFLFVMMNIAGYIVDWVKNNTKHSIFWRRMIYAFGYLWCAAFIVMIQNVQTSNQALMYICASFIGLAFTWPVGFSLPIEYAGHKAGLATGFMNMWGQLAAVISPIITGYVAASGNWGHAFWWAAVFSLAGAIIVLVTSKYKTGAKYETSSPEPAAN